MQQKCMECSVFCFGMKLKTRVNEETCCWGPGTLDFSERTSVVKGSISQSRVLKVRKQNTAPEDLTLSRRGQ